MLKMRSIFFQISVLFILFSELCLAAPISISQISDLDFGSAMLGDPAKTVNPGSVENSENASFLVTGDARSTFSISLPNNMWITNSSSGDRIRVRRFRSTPRNGRIRNNGERTVYVGATRDAIPAGLSPGIYSGAFTMTVVY